MNIGIHFFDLLVWFFGLPEKCEVYLSEPNRMGGTLELERARVRWFLSVDGADLPEGYLASGKSAFRLITIDGQEIEFSDGFGDLHTRVYEEILQGRGFGIRDARSSIELVHSIRTGTVVSPPRDAHPLLA